jgi:ATP-binding cassette subfamily B protein
MNEHSLPTAEERYSALSLIRRLLTEQGLVHWRKYAIAFTLMAVAAGCTAFSAYLIGDVINQAYVNRSLPGIIVIGAITVVLFSMKGLATYGHSVMLSRIGNRIVADNQRAVFSKLLNEGLGFFSDRHSTEFIARLSTGAAAATQVINLLITSIGRPTLAHRLITVMVVQDHCCRSSALSWLLQHYSFSANWSGAFIRLPAPSFMAGHASSKPCRRRCKASAS